LTDCKSGTLYISLNLTSFLHQRIESFFKYYSPFYPKIAEICVPKEFSLLSSSDNGDAHVAVFANMKNGHVIMGTLAKVGVGLNFSELAKNMSEKRFRELKKEYKDVLVYDTKENVKPASHCKCNIITDILDFSLSMEKKSLQMYGQLRIIGYSNGYLGIYAYVEPAEGVREGIHVVPLASENIVFSTERIIICKSLNLNKQLGLCICCSVPISKNDHDSKSGR